MSTQPMDPARKTFSDNLARQTSLYSLAAAAAGVSVLALAQPSEASVVITHKNISVTRSPGTSLDLNNDGVVDFTLVILGNGPGPSFLNTYLYLEPPNSANQVIGSKGASSLFGPYASALLRGAKIGPSVRGFRCCNHLIELDDSTNGKQLLFGEWGGNHPDRFLGVKFLIDGDTHYGWVRLTVNTKGPLTATITEYAYETIANKRVLAGEGSSDLATEAALQDPGPSLGMLALGADGVTLWRREATIIP